MAKKADGGAAEEKEPLKIHLDVLADQISPVIARVPGVAALAGGAIVDLGEKVGVRKPAKGIRVTVKEGAVVVDVHIAALFGWPIPEIARQAQRETKEILRDISPFPVTAVHVWVEEIHFDRTAEEYRRRAAEMPEEGKPQVAQQVSQDKGWRS
ncbi:MAG: Asp23/Gls24 family envelope stress response protein [Peptococcaceae bacterium]|jgi:uncharacterized alkaline shock family protein YloU|nr:Asp23/Gls24 family envelope stress response protein [Peptococcaceae bacterium]